MKNSGFTLVEVIVVSVILAAIALAAVQMYIGYKQDAQKQVLEHAAGSAASYLNAAINLGETVPGPSIAANLSGAAIWVTHMGSGDSSTFQAPTGITITISGSSVSAADDEYTSAAYQFR